MKKFLRLAIVSALTLVTVLSLVACGGTDKNTPFARGAINGNVYHSDFAGVTFTKPDNWKFSTDEEIAKLLGVGLDVLQSGDKFDASELASTIDFQASDPATGNNVNMSVEKLNPINAATVSIDDYIESFRSTLTTQFQGMSATFGDTTETTIGENTYKRVTANVQMSGVSMQQVYLLRKVGKYVVCITMTSTNGGDISSLEAMLS